MTNNEELIWNYLYQKTGNAFGTAAIIGNLFAESSLDPKCRTGKTDLSKEEYTEAADQGVINFTKDNVAYGLVQWRFWSRKQNLMAYARERETSVGNLQMQLDFLMLELPKYKTAYNAILKATDIRTASDVFMTKYEKPGNVSDAAKEKRAQKAWAYYLKYYRSDDTKIKMVKFTADRVRLRRGNGLNYPIVAQKNEGDILKWVATAENNWHAVEYDRQVVWCSGEYSEVV